MEEKMEFPKGFLWGSATASYQVEGGIGPVRGNEPSVHAGSNSVSRTSNGIENDWSVAAREGSLSTAGKRASSTGSGRFLPAAGFACDHYNRYEEDFNIAKSLNQNAHRLSIEWARIEPEEGKFDKKEIEHYRKVLDALRDRGLEPFVTLWHFTLPVWFAKIGGFENKRAPEYFARYCGYVVGELADKVKFWMTINEPIVYASNSYRVSRWPPFKKNIFKFMKVIKNLVTSHNIAYEKIKAVDPSAQIGIAKNNINFESNWNPFNHLLSSFLNFFWNQRFLRNINQDFIGLNYYFHKKFGDRVIYAKSDFNWDIYPKGIYNSLLQLKEYQKPVYITENGLSDKDDKQRADFIRDHLKWVARAIRDGSDCRGYFYWSLLDNFEWAEGYKQKFGLVEINFETLQRKIRPSAYEYAKICRDNNLIS